MYLLPVRRQASSAQQLVTGPGVPYDFYIGFMWAGFAVASIFIGIRLYARLRSSSSRRIYIDDAFILFGYILLLITAALWQWGAKDMYYILDLSAGHAQLEPDYTARLHRMLLVSFLAEFLFYHILIMFKLSLLFFFRRISSSADKFKCFWWPTLIYSVCTYFISVGTINYDCYWGSLEKVTVSCDTPSGTRFMRDVVDVNCALDVSSDFLIMIIPIILLWDIQVRSSKKIALFGLFSLSILTMAIAIARTADIRATQKANGLPDSSYLWFWSFLQSWLCMVVACASAFRQLFVASKDGSSKPTWTATDSFYDRMISSFQSRNKNQNDPNLYELPDANQIGQPFDYVSMRKESEVASQQSGRSPCVSPNPSMPVAAHGMALGQNYTHESQITKKVEYSVSR
ncbi:hypothetical protein PISL3812_06942 [Talaromyces islandicus]|uniref:Rhodopsin domain-containing protein n=1 Tax=Talaromyces islandicus TaxID=28573 RepID=A0A0U1M2S7_TALIS|nr:hypothetical protein PISL3812_06942 [Talaromyces islandicus]